MLIVAPGNNPDPVGTIARDLGDFTHTFAPRQEPDNLQVAPFHRIICFAVALLQLIGGEMGNDVNIFRYGIPSGRTALPEGILSGSEPRVNSAMCLINHYSEMVSLKETPSSFAPNMLC
jgi:hypothetical protein